MKMSSVPEFLIGATNVYRTRYYIVRQRICLRDGESGSYLVSHDTYFRCTPKLDQEYDNVFSDREDVDGKRGKRMKRTGKSFSRTLSRAMCAVKTSAS